MRLNRSSLFARPTLLLSLAAVLSATTALRADTVDYSTLPAGTKTSPLTVGGITATSSGTLATDGVGLGVVGGNGLDVIDPSESVHFAFDAGAGTGVMFTSDLAILLPSPTTGNFQVQGFAVGGASLGVVGVPLLATFPNFNISALFGNVQLSGFTLGGGDSHNVSPTVTSISFTPVTISATPEPSSILLLGTGVLAVAGSFRRKLSANS